MVIKLPDMPDLGGAVTRTHPNSDKSNRYQTKINTIEDQIIELDEEIRAPNQPKAFFCKTCNKGFRFLENLDKHMACHVASPIPQQQGQDEAMQENPPKSTAINLEPCTPPILNPEHSKPSSISDPSIINPGKRPSILLKTNGDGSSVIGNQPDPQKKDEVACPKCGKVFANYSNQKRHAKTCLGLLLPFKKSFDQPSQQGPPTLVVPKQEPKDPAAISRHSFPANFTCKTCQKTFRWRSDFERHERSHSKGKQQTFTCSCGKNFGTEKHFRIHERNCGLPEEVKRWAQGCTYSCQRCTAFTTKSKDLFKGHLKDAHNMSVSDYRNEFETVVTHGKFHICLICDTKVVHDEKYLDRHLKGHDVTLKAYYIDKVMGRAPAAVTTVATAGKQSVAEESGNETHQPEMDIECKTCQEKPSFLNLETFAVHLEKKHSGMTVKKYNKTVSTPFKTMNIYRCKMCSAILLSEAGLIKHLRNNHALEKMSIEEYNAMH